MKYADIILPLPLEGFFTYSVPESIDTEGLKGCRVVVPFGKTKTYVGLVANVHENKPQGYIVKPLKQQLDTRPVVDELQMRLWQWISDYYLAPMGDIYKAALPSGLKTEDGYKPSTELYVTLAPPFRSEPALHIALNMLKKSKKQLDVFTCYLQMSHWDSCCGNTSEGDDMQNIEGVVEITRDELLYWTTETQYCGKCGGVMERDTQISRRCTRCGHTIWPQLATAVIVLIHRGDEVLLVKAHSITATTTTPCRDPYRRCCAIHTRGECQCSIFRSFRSPLAMSWSFSTAFSTITASR